MVRAGISSPYLFPTAGATGPDLMAEAARMGVAMNIYVGNLALEVTETEIRREFLPFGVVASVNMMNDKYIGSGQQRGYSFVEMPSTKEGEAAIAGLNGKALKGRNISLVEAMSMSHSEHTGSHNKRRTRVRQSN
jgi:RNA recognition motif-containing protein